MIKANSSIITTNTEAPLSWEHPYLKYRTELLIAVLHPLIIDVDLHKRQSVCCWIWFTGRDSACRGVSTFHWILKVSVDTTVPADRGFSWFVRSLLWTIRTAAAAGARVSVGVRLKGAVTVTVPNRLDLGSVYDVIYSGCNFVSHQRF